MLLGIGPNAERAGARGRAATSDRRPRRPVRPIAPSASGWGRSIFDGLSTAGGRAMAELAQRIGVGRPDRVQTDARSCDHRCGWAIRYEGNRHQVRRVIRSSTKRARKKANACVCAPRARPRAAFLPSTCRARLFLPSWAVTPGLCSTCSRPAGSGPRAELDNGMKTVKDDLDIDLYSGTCCRTFRGTRR